MRIITVAGVMALGLGLGTLAVLGPFADRAAAPTGTNWYSSLASASLREVASLAERLAKPKPSATEVPVVTALTSAEARAAKPQTAPASDVNESQTLAFLSQPSALTQAADARIIEKPWTAQVTVASDAAPRKMTSSKPTTEEQRYELVRDIQRELKRVGCYEGAADGQWSGATKRAMGTFTDRVNASLPFEQPDLILLTLVKGQRGMTCGKDCPSGQGFDDGGRCTPNSVLARGDHARPDGTKNASAGAAAARPRETKPANRETASTAWTTTVVRTPTETGSAGALMSVAALPATAAAPKQPEPQLAPVVAEASVTVRTGSPLPGRMAIGGPLLAATVTPDAEDAAPVTSAALPAAAPLAVVVPKVRSDRTSAPRARPASLPLARAPKHAHEATGVHRPPPPTYRGYVQRPPSRSSRGDSYVYQLVRPPGT